MQILSESGTSPITRRDLLTGMAAAATTTVASARSVPEEKDHSTHPTGLQKCAASDIPLHELTDKVAVITGGSSGIGLGIAQACIHAGMKIVITYRSEKHLEAALGTLPADENRVHAIKVDVTDAPVLHQAAKECAEVFGKVHLLVNNAGVQNDSPLSEISREQWDELMNVNVGGVLNGVQAFLPYLTQHKEGSHVVTTASILGLFTVGGGYAAYCASKFAVVAMMETLRAELAPAGVGVSIFCPGLVKSNLEAGLADHPAASNPIEVGERLLQGVRRNALYILTHPEFSPIIQDRFALLQRSSGTNLSVSEARQALANRMASENLYSQEFARMTCW